MHCGLRASSFFCLLQDGEAVYQGTLSQADAAELPSQEDLSISPGEFRGL